MRALLKNAMLIASVAVSSNAAAFRTAGDLEQFSDTERVRWANSDVSYDLYSELPFGISEFAMETAANAAFGAWSGPECTGVSISPVGVTDSPAAPGDERNTIQFIYAGWEDLGYPANAPGATDTQYEEIDGEWQIVGADVYLNAEYFEWTTSPSPPQGQRTVFSTLFHEAGHVLGLLHPCEEDSTGEAPSCEESGLTPSSSVMYPFYDFSQSALTSDDQAGVCYLYPACETLGCPDGFECRAEGCLQACAAEGDGGVCHHGEICAAGGCESVATCGDGGCLDDIHGDDDPPCDPGYYRGDSGACVTGDRALGDPCTESQQCDLGTCSDGHCTPLCLDDECLPDGGTVTCFESPDGSSACFATGSRAFGEACEKSNQCLGGQCLSISGSAVCTRRCGEDEPACPSDWTCGLVEERAVCIPAPATASGGCAVGQPRTLRELFTLLGLALCVAIRRTRRTRFPRADY